MQRVHQPASGWGSGGGRARHGACMLFCGACARVRACGRVCVCVCVRVRVSGRACVLVHVGACRWVSVGTGACSWALLVGSSRDARHPSPPPSWPFIPPPLRLERPSALAADQPVLSTAAAFSDMPSTHSATTATVQGNIPYPMRGLPSPGNLTMAAVPLRSCGPAVANAPGRLPP